MLDNPLIVFLAASAGALGLIVALYVVYLALIGRRWAVYALVAVVVFLLDAVFRTRDFEDKSVDFQIVLKLACWGLIFLIATIRFSRFYSSLFQPAQALWLAFFCWLCVSTLYAPSFIYSAAAVFSLAALYLFALSLSRDYDPDTVLAAAIAGIAAFCLVSIIVYFAVPSFGRLDEWAKGVRVVGNRMSGIAGTPNSMGRIAAFGLLILAFRWRAIVERLGFRLTAAGAIMMAVCLLVSNSRTSLALLIVIVGLSTIMTPQRLPYVLLGIAGAVLALLLILPYSNEIMVMLSRSGDASEITTGTSRSHIWEIVSQLAASKFWTGWGYGSSVFIIPTYAKSIGHTALHSHNIMLQLWFSVGMIGVLLFVAALAAQLHRAVRIGDGLTVAFIAFTMLNGITESSAFTGLANITTLSLVLAIGRGTVPGLAAPTRARSRAAPLERLRHP